MTRRARAAGVAAAGLIVGTTVIATVVGRPFEAAGSGSAPQRTLPTTTLSPDQARFCLQAPFSGTIAFSNLDYVQLAPGPLPDEDMPTMYVSVADFPASQTVSVIWRERSGRQFNPIAVFSTDAQGSPTAIRILRRAVLPANDITLDFRNGPQKTGSGSGVVC